MKSHKGKIDIICGSMFSGKTEELIRRLKRLDFAKKNINYLNQLLIIDMTIIKSFHTI